MKKIIRIAIAAAFFATSFAQADPISLTPSDASHSGTECADCLNSTSAILTWLETYATGFDRNDLSYKSEVGGTEEGSFAGNYSTAYSNTTTDPSDATISWDGGAYIDGAAWLLVKDGNHSPWWYLFDISSWDGMMDIVLTGFWPNSGAISHVAIYGGERQVPEPGTLALLGLGLLGLGIARRKQAVTS